MNWTVKGKLIAMGALVLAGISALGGQSLKTNAETHDTVELLSIRNGQLSFLGEMERAQLGLTLAAMDAIIDRDAGSIDQELRGEIDHHVQILQGSLKRVAELADTPEEKRLAAAIAQNVDRLVGLVTADLPRLVESRGGSDAFAQMDDAIDEQADQLAGDLARLSASVRGEVEAARTAMQEELRRANLRLAAIFFLVLVVMIPSLVSLIRGIVAPLRKTLEMIREMEKGHLDSRLNLNRTDEIGQMAQAMDGFADSLQHEMVAALQKLADGDLSFSVEPRDGRDRVRGSLKKLGEDLNEIMAGIQTAGEQIASGSAQISDSSQSLSQGATEQASSLEEISSSMTQMGSQVTQSAENAGQANALSAEAKAAAENGNAQMQAMVAAMGEINESGQNISRIIKVIDEIAFQTNLLALNAAVEAARAGQHGKGFAVVAEEVRNLAARSAKAAKETAELIEGSVKKAENGAQIADKTAEALAEIVTGVTKVTDLVAEIAAASNEQAQGIGQVSQGLSQIDQVTQQNTANAEQSAAAAEELSSQAAQLRQMLARFTLKQQGSYRAVPSAAPAVKAHQEIAWSLDEKGGPAPQAPSQMIALDDAEFGKY